MDVKNVEKKDNGKLTFQDEVDSAAYESAVKTAYLKTRKKKYDPGFRCFGARACAQAQCPHYKRGARGC